MKHILLTLACLTVGGSLALGQSFNPPTMGWSTWNTFGINISDQLMREQADAMISTGLSDCGFKFINIDDGFMNGRDAQGNLQVNLERFPLGMRPLVDYIHSRGLKAGIYSDAGNNTCASGDEHEWGLGVGMVGHEEQDSKLFFIDWDFDFIKVDYCGGSRSGLLEQEQYTKISKAIYGSGKLGLTFNVCRWAFPGTWVRDIADSWRTTGDIRDSWDSLKKIIRQNLFLQAYTGDGHYNDCDMLEMGRSLTPDEERTHMAYWCIASSPLLIGCDMRNIPQSTLDLLRNKDLIAMNQDPLGLGAPVVQFAGYEDYVLVVAKDVETLGGSKRAVVVMNLTDEPRHLDVDLKALGFSDRVSVYDCFDHKILTDNAALTFGTDIPAHGSQAYFMSGERAEQTLYQAENAYLQGYEEMGRTESPMVRRNRSACGGNYVHHIGNRPENYLLWKNVYSYEGGDYEMSIRYASMEPREMTVSVGEKSFPRLKGLSSGDYTNKWNTVTVKIHLNKGANAIKLENKTGWMPNIDCMTLKKL